MKTRRKADKKTQPAGFFTRYYLLVFALLLRMIGMATVPPPAVKALPASRDKKIKNVKKVEEQEEKSTGKIISDLKKAVTSQPVAAPVKPTPQTTVPKLLKFSIHPDQKKKVDVVRAADTEPEKKPIQNQPKEVKKTFSPPLWRTLKVLVSNTRLTMIKDAPKPEGTPKAYDLIDNLAFLYRFHVLNLALKVLIREGDDKYKLHMSRTDLVHRLDSHLFASGVITSTRESLRGLDLSELNDLSPERKEIDGFDIAAAMVELPLCQLLAVTPDKYMQAFTKKEIAEWLMNTAIPLFNTIAIARDHTEDTDQKKACDDAMKMMIIIMGEYCPKCDKFDDDKFTLTNSGKLDDFMVDCRLLRNFYSHKAVTHERDDLQSFIDACIKITGKHFGPDNEHFDKMLSPHRAKVQMHEAATSKLSRHVK